MKIFNDCNWRKLKIWELGFVSDYEYIQYASIFYNTEHFIKIYVTAIEQWNNEDFLQTFSTLDGI